MHSDEPDGVVLDVEQVPQHRQRWVAWTVFMVVTIVIFALVAVSISWNVSSEKALLDAADYAMKNPGTYQVQAGKNLAIVARTDGRLYAVEGTLKGVPVAAIASSSTLYVKSSDPEKLYDTLLGKSESKAAKELFGSLLKNLKNQWISFDLESVSKTSSLFGSIRCFFDTKSMIAGAQESSMLSDAGSAYLSHRFMAIKKSNPSQYQITVDGEKLSAFQGAYSQTETLKELDSCSQTFDSFDPSSFNDAKIKIDLSKSKHVLETLTYEGSVLESTKIKADYGRVEQITAPSNSIDVSQIIGSLIGSILDKGGAQ